MIRKLLVIVQLARFFLTLTCRYALLFFSFCLFLNVGVTQQEAL